MKVALCNRLILQSLQFAQNSIFNLFDRMRGAGVGIDHEQGGIAAAGGIKYTDLGRQLLLDHQFFVVPASQRYEALKRLIDFNPGMYGIIFTRTKADAQEVSERLAKSGYEIEALHGDLSQQQRDKVMGRFRSKNLQLLIATDVAARGIDVDGIGLVVNYDVPPDPEDYIHRIGRTGRANKIGQALTFIEG